MKRKLKLTLASILFGLSLGLMLATIRHHLSIQLGRDEVALTTYSRDRFADYRIRWSEGYVVDAAGHVTSNLWCAPHFRAYVLTNPPPEYWRWR